METFQETIKLELEPEELTIKLFVTTNESEKFIDELEKICKNFAVNEEYFFTFK